MASRDDDRAEVRDNPLWTEETFARSKSFAETFPDLEKRRRGPQKAPKKVQVTIRLDPRVVEHFRAGGPGWQVRMGDALKEVVDGTATPARTGDL